MSKTQYVMALDLGTTGNRALVFDANGQVVGQVYRELTQHYPKPGWVEHDPMTIWQDTLAVSQAVLAQTHLEAADIAAIGLTVQRETCLLWDKTTGQPLHPAIVWQDRRTSALCHKIEQQGYTELIRQHTGLVLDAYFSATKLAWMLERVQQQTPNLDLNNVLAGTIDTWILWNLTGRRVHATDHSNASRTLLLNLKDCTWDAAMLDLFGIPVHLMPALHPSLGKFGTTDATLLGAEVPIAAIFGDQQAALYAHGCDRPGLLKCTYGTGCFLVSHTGSEIVRSRHQLLSTVAWTEATEAGPPKVGYALEGSMFTTGACIQWIRDGLQWIREASETDALARQVDDNNGVYFVPALSGLGAPHWDMSARGAFLGLTRGATQAHMVRAVLESIAYQVKEVVDAVNADSDTPIQALTVDGGACQNDFLMQFQSDVLGIPVERPVLLDATAQGAAFGAGLTCGFWQDYDELVRDRKLDRVFTPGEGAAQAQANFSLWQKAVERAKYWTDD